MSNYRKFAMAFIVCQLMLLTAFNVYALNNMTNASEKSYVVDISRIVTRMEAGEPLSSIDLDEYETVISASAFDPAEHGKYPYTVEEVGGVLYRFEYEQEGNKRTVIAGNLIFGFTIAAALIALAYLDRKLVTPFAKMSDLPAELAKGNLSMPVKEEKSKYFGKFLWGMDMLREKLEEDKRRELQLVKEKKTLILSLSHDVKTPLSAIDLYTKALETGLYDSEEKKREVLRGIENNVSEIKRYVEEITDASREDFLSLDVRNEEVYLLDCMDKIKTYYDEKMAHIHTEFTVENIDDCLIYADGDRLVEVMQNIIENAVKYGDGKKVDITFGEEENCKLITITNTGCEIGEDELPHLFDAFYRGSNSENADGSGLGLYICRELMHRMDGDIFAKITGEIFGVTLILRKM